MRMPVNHFSSNTLSDDTVRKRIHRIERILQSRRSSQHLEDDLAAALGRVESLLGLSSCSESNPQPISNSIKEAPAGSSASPSTTYSTGGSQNNSHASGRPVLFAEASNKRWSVDSAVGKAATGISPIDPRLSGLQDVIGLPGSDEISQTLPNDALVLPGLPSYDHGSLLFHAYCEEVNPFFNIVPPVRTSYFCSNPFPGHTE
jgi:hypothetical protein